MQITLEEAKQIVTQHSPSCRSCTISPAEALGCTLAEPVFAIMDQPPFRRSCMDGYAMRSCEAITGRYIVYKEADAGCTEEIQVPKGQVLRIMTGARVPDDLDLVVPQEMTDYNDEIVMIQEFPKRSNIAPVGEDFHKGDLLLDKGQLITAGAAASLYASGITSVNVYRKLRVAILSTGDELVVPGNALLPGQIYDTNLAYLKCRLQELGFEIALHKIIKDDLSEIKDNILRAVSDADYLITTGGVSVGKKDLLEAAILACKGSVLFHGIQIKPGMPTMFSMIEDTPVLSLSGNPFSAWSMFEYLFPTGKNLYTFAPLEETYTGKRPQTRIVRGYWNGDTIKLFTNQKNGTTRDSARANCLAELPPGSNELTAGTKIRIKLL